MAILFKKIEEEKQVTVEHWVDLEGLTLTLPRRLGSLSSALVTLNVPRPYAKGSNFPSVAFGVAANGAVVALGEISSDHEEPESSGRRPVTVVCQINLQEGSTTEVKALWRQSRGSVGVIDSFASLSAILG